MNSTAEYTISDISEIDWNRVIKRKKEMSVKPPKNGSEFWNMRAPSFADHAGKTFYPDSFIRIMEPDPSWTVLDMGCGGGTLALPLSDKVKHITAADFSDRMIEILRNEADRRGIKNINTVNTSWEDDWTEAGIGVYDIAIASRSLAVDDIGSAIKKLIIAASRRVIISTVVGDGPFDRKMFEAIGRERAENIDYIYIYNLLYQMGILANIAFIVEDESKLFISIDDACESFRWMFQNMTSQEESLLKEYMRAHLVEVNGSLVLDYSNKHRWAVIWWDIE